MSVEYNRVASSEFVNSLDFKAAHTRFFRLSCRFHFPPFCINSCGEKVPSLQVGCGQQVWSSTDSLIKPHKFCRSSKNKSGNVFKAMPGTAAHHESDTRGMKIYLVSDVHTDHVENLEWIRNLSPTEYKQHTLILAGDVSDNLETFEITMKLLKEKFNNVFFVPGNHDLWCRREEDNVSDMRVECSELLSCLVGNGPNLNCQSSLQLEPE